MGLAIAFILGQVVAFVGPHLGLSAEWAERINVFGGYLLSIIFVGPLLIQMMLRKRFKGFIMQIVWQP